MDELRLGFLASHNGSNVQAIVDACKDGRLDAKPCIVISNNSRANVLVRAEREGVPTRNLSVKTHPVPGDLDRAIAETLQEHGVNLVVLAGYMKELGPETLSRFKGRILNTHPALLPKYGGKGMYGMRVHEAVLTAGERVTGATVHLVEGDYDTGPAVWQVEVPVLENDTAETLGERVLQHEHVLYVEVLQRISTGDIDLEAIDVVAASANRPVAPHRDSTAR